jgi:hypothetical protein
MSLAEYVEMLDKAGLLTRYSDEKRVAELIEQALHGALPWGPVRARRGRAPGRSRGKPCSR